MFNVDRRGYHSEIPLEKFNKHGALARAGVGNIFEKAGGRLFGT